MGLYRIQGPIHGATKRLSYGEKLVPLFGEIISAKSQGALGSEAMLDFETQSVHEFEERFLGAFQLSQTSGCSSGVLWIERYLFSLPGFKHVRGYGQPFPLQVESLLDTFAVHLPEAFL